MNDTQIDMVQKLKLGLHLITKRLGLCMPNHMLSCIYVLNINRYRFSIKLSIFNGFLKQSYRSLVSSYVK